MLEYDLYLSEGLPITTGVIEGAYRHLIKDRMDLTGVRWRLKSAEAVLRIRSFRSSGGFEEYWVFTEPKSIRGITVHMLPPLEWEGNVNC